jgi:hypothetical protein
LRREEQPQANNAAALRNKEKRTRKAIDAIMEKDVKRGGEGGGKPGLSKKVEK